MSGAIEMADRENAEEAKISGSSAGHWVRFEPRNFTIFISAALFSYAEQAFNRLLRDALVAAGYKVILPQEFDAAEGEPTLFLNCVNGAKDADLVLAVVDGAEVDAGVGFEMGVAYSAGTPILSLRTDFRRKAETTDGCLNLMLQYGSTSIIAASDDPFREVVSAVRDVLQKIEF